MIHARPQIKIHPAQGGTIPTFPRSHTPGAAATPHHSGTTSPAPDLTSEITHGDIAERAYDIYSRSGYREGQSQQNWEQAEKDLRESGVLACHSEHAKEAVFAPDSIAAE